MENLYCNSILVIGIFGSLSTGHQNSLYKSEASAPLDEQRARRRPLQETINDRLVRIECRISRYWTTKEVKPVFRRCSIWPATWLAKFGIGTFALSVTLKYLAQTMRFHDFR
jgi:hypothetical protein